MLGAAVSMILSTCFYVVYLVAIEATAVLWKESNAQWGHLVTNIVCMYMHRS